MSIDVKIFASERLTDATNGGGRITATEIPDGVVNNMFANISESDRVGGRINIRKGYVKASTNDTALYQALSVMIDREPADPAVDGVIFSDGSWNSLRGITANGTPSITDYLENYLAAGPKSDMYMYGKQAKNQRSYSVLQRPEAPLPQIGNVYFLDDGTNVQPVRVNSLTQVLQTFTDSIGDFQRRNITLGIDQALLYQFQGGDATRFSVDAPTLVRTSIVADSANYYGIAKLTGDLAASGGSTFTTSAQLTSIFAQLVPSNTAETSITGAIPAASQYLVASSPSVTVIKKIPSGPHTVYVGAPFAPGSMTLVYEDLPGNLANPHGTYKDNGDGTFAKISGTSLFSVIADYAQGTVTASGSGFLAYNPSYTQIAFTLKYATQVSRQSFTAQQPVTEGTRGYVYNATLSPVPAPATLVVSYLSSGKWYDLTDDGTGILSGLEGTGGGSVRYDTGTETTTLGALPDIGSSIIQSWGPVSDYEIRTGDITIKPPSITGNLSHFANRNSVIITWTTGGVTKTATDDGAGNLAGDGTGTIIYSSTNPTTGASVNGSFTLYPTLLPDKNTAYAVAYNDTSIAVAPTTLTPTHASGKLTFTIPGAPIKPGGVSFPISLIYNGTPLSVVLSDNGFGGFTGFGIYGLATGPVIAGATIDYTSGAVSVPDSYIFAVLAPAYASILAIIPSRVVDGTTLRYTGYEAGLNYQYGSPSVAVNFSYQAGSPIVTNSISAGGTNRSQSDSFAARPLILDLTPTVSSPVISNSTAFVFGGSTYFDRNGVLYRNVDPATNSGIVAGTFDPISGNATITDWTVGATGTLSVISLLTQPGLAPIVTVNGRAPGNPLRVGSFYIQARRANDNTLINCTADANGNLTSADMHGTINTLTGVYNIAFGAYVLNSGLSDADKAQPWYSAANVGGDGYIFRPAPIIPGSMTYNCVVESYLPQNPLLLGLDPTRLPNDGRVPIIRPSYKLVFHENALFTMPGSLTSGQVVDIGVTNLRDTTLYDAHGTLVINTSGTVYAVNIVTGHITMGTSLDLSAYTQPLVANYRWEDLVECTDTQIGGQIKFSPPLVHGYSAANARVSSLLEFGDVSANYQNLFAQQTWANVFLDVRAGDPITPQFDDLTYPVQVVNRDCETLRVAYIFTSASGGNIAIEGRGIIGTFTTSANSAPLNLAGNPMWVLNHLGWGVSAGWSVGNAARFNFQGAGSPFEIARTVLQAPATATSDSLSLQTRYSKS
jgi:hypothetical protein